MSNVLIDSAILQLWGDTVREKTGTDEKMKPDVLLQKTQNEWGTGGNGSDSGINLIDYVSSCSFRGVVLPENTIIKMTPKNPINTNLSSVFRSVTNMIGVEIDYDFGESTYNLGYFADGSGYLEYVDFKGRTILLSGSNTNAFNSCVLLKEINAVFDFTNVTSLATFFNRCFELEEVRFVSGSIPTNISFSNSAKLSDLSIKSIIDGLTDRIGQTSQTLTVHKDVRAKIESNPQQLATIVDKNWTLAQA